MCMDARNEGMEKWEAGSSQQSLLTGQEATCTNEIPQIPPKQKKHSYCEMGQRLAQIPQRG